MVCSKLSYGYNSEPGSPELGHDINICNVFADCPNCPLLFNDKQQIKKQERRNSDEIQIVETAVEHEGAFIRQGYRHQKKLVTLIERG